MDKSFSDKIVANLAKILRDRNLTQATMATYADTTPYSGLYIFPISNMTLVSLLKILNSLDFKNYTKKVGICVSGTSRRISPKDIENYVFKE